MELVEVLNEFVNAGILDPIKTKKRSKINYQRVFQENPRLEKGDV
jgi:hypothetical protein